VLATVANGDGGQYAHYLMDASTQGWTQVSRYEDQIAEAHLGTDGHLYLLSRKDAPRGKVLSVKLDSSALAKAQEIVPETAAAEGRSEELTSIVDIVPTDGRLFVLDIAGGPMQVRVFAITDMDRMSGGSTQVLRKLQSLAIPPVSSVYQLTPTENGNAMFQVASYLKPPAWFEYDAKSDKTTRTAMVTS